MLNAVVGPSETRRQAAAEDWQTFLTATATEAREMYLTHPWAIQTNWSRPVLGPASVADLELFLEGVKDLPLSDAEKMNLATTIDSNRSVIVCYFVQLRIARRRWAQSASSGAMSEGSVRSRVRTLLTWRSTGGQDRRPRTETRRRGPPRPGARIAATRRLPPRGTGKIRP